MINNIYDYHYYHDHNVCFAKCKSFPPRNIKYTLLMCHDSTVYSVISDPIVYDENENKWQDSLDTDMLLILTIVFRAIYSWFRDFRDSHVKNK